MLFHLYKWLSDHECLRHAMSARVSLANLLLACSASLSFCLIFCKTYFHWFNTKYLDPIGLCCFSFSLPKYPNLNIPYFHVLSYYQNQSMPCVDASIIKRRKASNTKQLAICMFNVESELLFKVVLMQCKTKCWSNFSFCL